MSDHSVWTRDEICVALVAIYFFYTICGYFLVFAADKVLCF